VDYLAIVLQFKCDIKWLFAVFGILVLLAVFRQIRRR